MITLSKLKGLIASELSVLNNPEDYEFVICCRDHRSSISKLTAISIREKYVTMHFGPTDSADFKLGDDPKINTNSFLFWVTTDPGNDNSFYVIMKTDNWEGPVERVKFEVNGNNVLVVFKFGSGTHANKSGGFIKEEFGVDDGLGLNDGKATGPIGKDLFDQDTDQTDNLWGALVNPANKSTLAKNGFMSPRYVHICKNDTIDITEDNNPEEYYSVWKDLIEGESDEFVYFPVVDNEDELKSVFNMTDESIAKFKALLWNVHADYSDILKYTYSINVLFDVPYRGPMYGPNAAVSPPDPEAEHVSGSTELDEFPIVIVDEQLFKQLKDMEKLYEIPDVIIRNVPHELDLNREIYY